jgi:DNA methyltransferase 1-associated protein 1
VIHDRWLEYFYAQDEGNPISTRKVEDLQERYYSVAAILGQIRITQEAEAEVRALSSVVPDPTAPNAAEKADQLLLETAAARALATVTPKAQPLMTNLGTGSTNKMFDVVQERERRANLDRMWRRSKEEEKEEMELRKELREIEAQLRKLKKSGGHLLAAAGNRLPNSASSRNPSRSVTPVPGTAIVENPDLLNQSFASTAPVPMPQNPYLQSGRLAPPAAGGSVGLNKSMLTRMQQVLTELKIPARPLPTKRVCDVYDQVRKDILTLITLQKLVMQKEGTLHAKRVKLAKLGVGNIDALDEEALLGITPPPTPHAVASVSAAKKPTKSGGSSSKPKPSGNQVKAKAPPKPKAPTVEVAKKQDNKDPKDAKDSKDSASKSKSSTKRKRKPSDDPGKESKEPAMKGTKPAVVTGGPPSNATVPTAKAPTKTPTPAATTETKASVAPVKTSASADAITEPGSGKKRARK